MTVKEYKEKALKDPKVKKAYDELKEKYKVIREEIRQTSL